MGISYIEMNEQKIPIEDEELRGVVGNMQGEIDKCVRTLGYTVSNNLLTYPYYETTKTNNGATYTDNGDGTISVSGTPTTTTSFLCRTRTGSPALLKKDTYILNGCHKGGSESTHKMSVFKTGADGSTETVAIDYGEGVTFTLEEDTNIGVTISVLSTNVAVDLLFKPMIVKASLGIIPFEPYVADLKSLVCDVEPIQEAVLIDFTSESMFECYRYTATRRCLVHLSATAYYSNSLPKTVRIMKNGDTTTLGVFGLGNSNNVQALNTSGFAILEKGENINVQARYFTTGKNNIHLSGCVQYLE